MVFRRLALQMGRMWAHLFAGVMCSCGTAAGVCDERALEPGFLTSGEVPSQRGGSLYSQISQPKWRTRTPGGATLRPSSSATTTRSSYCTAASTFITSADSPSPAVTLPHGTCTQVEIINHRCCLSCWDRGICKPSLRFFSPSPSSPGLFVPRTREKFSSRKKQSSENKFETSCWAISEGKGTGGTVLSNNICAIQSARDGRGGRNQALTEGGWRWGKLKLGVGVGVGGAHRDGCFLLSDMFH